MNSDKSSWPKSLWWAGASVVLMVVGAFGPWVTVEDLIALRGTDGGRDGWVVVAAAGVALVGIVLAVRRRHRWVALALLAGVVSAATTASDLSDIRAAASTAAASEGALSLVTAEWGIYLALAGSISLALSSIAILIEGRRALGMSAELPSEA